MEIKKSAFIYMIGALFFVLPDELLVCKEPIQFYQYNYYPCLISNWNSDSPASRYVADSGSIGTSKDFIVNVVSRSLLSKSI